MKVEGAVKRFLQGSRQGMRVAWTRVVAMGIQNSECNLIRIC